MNSTDIIWNELKKYPYEEQLVILEDCGFHQLIENSKINKDSRMFKIMLKDLTILCSNNYGNTIKLATWKGIYETIIKQLEIRVNIMLKKET